MSVTSIPGAGFRQICSMLGLILSAYAVYVEWKVHHIQEVEQDVEEEFTALCDIEAIGASCRYEVSKIFFYLVVILFAAHKPP